MEGKDNIKDLFSQKLGNYEAKVNPELWAKISTQVAAGATTTVATGLSMFTKVAIGLGISAAAITTVVLLTNTTPDDSVTEEPKTEIKQETSNTSSTEVEKVAELDDSGITELRTTNDVQKKLIPLKIPEFNEMPSVGTDFSINGMEMKEVEVIGDDQASEPTIVEGVTYGDMTNYGASPANESETIIETPIQKAEPIKRYVNIFTPNGDGKNDYFELESEGLTDFSVVVFDPSGEIVFQSNDPKFRWDGRDIRTGDVVDSGTYMYMVSAYDSDGNPFPIYERLAINR